MEYIPLNKLLGGMHQQLLSGIFRLADQEDLAVLQLVAKTNPGRYLVKSGLSPQPAGDRLVFQPGIGHEIECFVRGFHFFTIDEA